MHIFDLRYSGNDFKQDIHVNIIISSLVYLVSKKKKSQKVPKINCFESKKPRKCFIE